MRIDGVSRENEPHGKIQIKSEKLTPFGGISSIMEQFDALLAQTIDSTLVRCYNCTYTNFVCCILFLGFEYFTADYFSDLSILMRFISQI